MLTALEGSKLRVVSRPQGSFFVVADISEVGHSIGQGRTWERGLVEGGEIRGALRLIDRSPLMATAPTFAPPLVTAAQSCLCLLIGHCSWKCLSGTSRRAPLLALS